MFDVKERIRLIIFIVGLILGLAIEHGALAADTSAVVTKELQQEEVKVYPNPAQRYLYINLGDQDKEVQLSIVSLIGNSMKVNFTKQDNNIYVANVNKLTKGYYYVLVKSSEGSIISMKKFLKT